MTDVSDDRKYLFYISMKGYMYFYDDSTLASGRGRYVDIVVVVAYVVMLSVVVKPCLCRSAIEG